jgi:hypothetical protein
MVGSTSAVLAEDRRPSYGRRATSFGQHACREAHRGGLMVEAIDKR